MSQLTQPALGYKPHYYSWAIQFAERSEKAHWGEWEIELQDDVKQWKMGTLSTIEKNHITQILKLFTQSDVQVAANYCDFFIPEFQNHEIRQMLLSFAAREGTHQRAYALLNDTLGLSESEYSAFLSDPEMKAKIQWMSAIPDQSSLLTLDSNTIARLLARAVCNEGMSLFSAFAMLMNYQRFGKMKGMGKVVEWSVRDETLHLQGMTRLFQEYCKENPQVVTDDLKASIYQDYREAVHLEDKVIELAYKLGPIEGLESSEMKVYIRYIADRRLVSLGLKPNWNHSTNPLPWLDWIMGGDTLTSFFEQKVSDYTQGGMVGDWGW